MNTTMRVLGTATSTSPVPPVPGFIESSFNPLLYDAGSRCLRAHPGDGARTAVVLASVMGDATTVDVASQQLVSGQVHNPLLFMQASSNSVLGYLSREFAITGQLTCLSVRDGLVGELLGMAALLLEDAELDRVLVLGVELLPNERTGLAYRELAAAGGRAGAPALDLAVALLLGRSGPPHDLSIVVTAAGGHGHDVAALAELAAACRQDGSTHLQLTPAVPQRFGEAGFEQSRKDRT